MAQKTERELIVVPLDGSWQSEQVIPYAEALRNRGGALLFVQVVDPAGPARGLFGDIEITVEDLIEQERAASRERLQEIAERWSDVLKKKPEIEAYAGDAAEAIAAIVDERQATMLALATSGRGALGRFAFGSVADTLMRNAPAPTLIIHPDNDAPEEPGPVTFERILVPLDGSELAEQALPEAARLAAAAKLPVVLLQVINPSLEFSMLGQGMAPITAELYEEVSRDFTQQANEALDRGADLLGEIESGVTKTVLEGGTVEAIRRYAKPGDLIVMTSHGRSGFQRFLLGSVAQKIIHERVAPVVLVPTRDDTKS